MTPERALARVAVISCHQESRIVNPGSAGLSVICRAGRVRLGLAAGARADSTPPQGLDAR